MSKPSDLHLVLKAFLRKPLTVNDISSLVSADLNKVSSVLNTLIDKKFVIKDEKE